MLLDSNILIHASRAPAPAIWNLLANGNCATASVVRIEVYGFTGLDHIEQAALDEIFRHLHTLPLDDSVVARAITLRQQRRMSLADAVIAATASAHDLPLATRNSRDFKHVSGLRLIDPFVENP
jgi:hypothetical protein